MKLDIKPSVLLSALSTLAALGIVFPAHAATVTLKWQDHCPNEQGFKIERAISQAGPYTQIATVGANVVAYADTSAAAGTTYYYRVRAYTSTWNSVYTNVAAKTVIPVPPTGLTATAGAAGTRKITLSWTASSGAASYVVYRASSSGGTYSQIGTSTTAGYVNTGLTAGSTYWYKTASVNAGGTSAQTAAVSAVAR